tara:strand:- start:1422 stop:1670 length:249 start_codon:yes stop_codon:yes gene_type:complete
MPLGRTKPKKATSLDGFVDPTSGRVTTQHTKDGEMIYQLDGKDVNLEDGFSLSVGKDKTPNTIRSSFSHISQEQWDKIFRRK